MSASSQSPACLQPHIFNLGTNPPAETLRLLARYLLRLCADNDPLSAQSDRADPARHNTPFHARAAPAIELEAYLARILKYCPCANEVFLALAVYAQRLRKVLPVDRFNVHRFCISGVVVGSKFFSDVFYTNTRYAKVGGLPVMELNQLELRFMEVLQYRCHVTIDVLQETGDMLLTGFRPRPTSMAIPAPPLYSAPPTPTVPMDISQMAWRPQVETPVVKTMPIYNQQGQPSHANSGPSSFQNGSGSVLNFTRQYGHPNQPPPRPLSAGAQQTAFMTSGGALRRETLPHFQTQPGRPMSHHPQQHQPLARSPSGDGRIGSPARHQRAMSYQNGPSSSGLNGRSPNAQAAGPRVDVFVPRYVNNGPMSAGASWHAGMAAAPGTNTALYYPANMVYGGGFVSSPTHHHHQRWPGVEHEGSSGRTPPSRGMSPHAMHQHRASLPHIHSPSSSIPSVRVDLANAPQPHDTPFPRPNIGLRDSGVQSAQDAITNQLDRLAMTSGSKSTSPRRCVDVVQEEREVPRAH